MTDVHDAKTRSYNMSRIKSKNTMPEMIVRKFLFSKGFRYRLHDKRLPGKPDIVLPKYKTIIFVNGCFWHGHEDCVFSKLPKTRTEWWTKKIENTMLRDIEVNTVLRNMGWKVLEIWTCELKNDKFNNLQNLVDAIII